MSVNLQTLLHQKCIIGVHKELAFMKCSEKCKNHFWVVNYFLKKGFPTKFMITHSNLLGKQDIAHLKQFELF